MYIVLVLRIARGIYMENKIYDLHDNIIFYEYELCYVVGII